ncbi:hypothetical protein ACGFMK_05420 [Amycolatopsis sp. NPDC049252]|uniref:hypothetical protein n=1 Tax=Amycolatopsis sp. NPDC049252 TaxID=3363933 RepID=UPI00371F1701
MRKTTLVAAGAALVLTLTACSGNAATGTAQPAGANGQSQADGGSGLASPFTDAIKLASASKQGTEKSKSAKFTMESSVGGQSMTASGAMSFDGANTKMSMTSSAAGQETEIRILDGAFYIKMPAEQAKQLGSGKQWIKFAPGGDDPFSQMLGSSSQSAEQSDPSKILDQVSKTGRIVSSDQTELNGQKVNHYVVEMDVAKSVDEFTKSMPEATRAKVAETLKGKDVKIPAEFWLDKDNLPVQVTMDQGPLMQAMGVPGADSSKFTMKYTDWGTQVDVVAPPADQVADLGELLKGGR